MPSTPAGPSTSTPCGAVPASKLRKREADRKAQRIAREKTKNRIAHLEGLVEELSRRDGNATAVSLMNQLSRVTEQRNKLMDCMEATLNVLSRHLSEAKALDPKTEDEIPVSTANIAQGDADSGVSDAPEVLPVQPSPQGFDSVDLALPDIGLDAVFDTTIFDLTCPCSTSTSSRRLSDGSLVNRNNWKAGNEILREPFAVTGEMLGTEYQVSEDIPVHAVMHGWDSLAHSVRMTPLWRKVRQLDELCFSACGQAERLAVLFMVHLLMRAYADPGQGKDAFLPGWYLKTPLQGIYHDPSADYFTWPAVRYRFATTPHRYCHNVFWHLFREHLRIAWPFDFRDCYVRDAELGAYGLSPLFKARIHDLRAWTMEADFFVRFPELARDIPRFPGQPSPADGPRGVAGPLFLCEGELGAEDERDREKTRLFWSGVERTGFWTC
ncbi:hypothetical protein Cob_v011509 [Colletotrichum orbiculare MAFF 240422]|uniref:Uncharacterized protein n=1 Tax=Colletotrichum orbiculare (strain 104-T / ATCC 96160 / CBS 514.97 / LARS 414 / MAFF 240422) TaxID=1213857 RepID=N4UMV2_COLOR|nr:hypothetical protein Cob_v011509 [Colletotrichum orbiculare MAFF 240422]